MLLLGKESIAPNGPKTKSLVTAFYLLFDFTRYKYCLSSVNTDTKLGRWR